MIGGRFVSALAVLLALAASMRGDAAAPQVSPSVYAEMRWRMIGPFQSGRTVAASGVPGQPNVFYMAPTNGGVWKTTDFGRVWTPLFDDQPTGSIGALAVAPSDPKIIYVGSGEGLQRPDLATGDGIYRSTDAGSTWTHLGLRDGQQIPLIIVDPHDPNRLFVAVLGHPYGPNEERGIFRSTNGGQTFEKVLYKDENTGGVDLAFDPANSQIVYAVLWESRQAPWENGVFTGPGSGMFKSIDGGTTWKPLTHGLPTFADGLGRIGISVAPSEPKRLYAIVQASARADGLYRSDDAGENWRQVNANSTAVRGSGDYAEVKVDPKNPDVIYTAGTICWKSTDGGRTFAAFLGAPAQDYHRFWINPDNPQIVLIAGDHGAIITVNGGDTWSSWFNQPSGQFYHVSTDNAFPYRVCGGQQERGSLCVQSRGDDGQITFREWMMVRGSEYDAVAPDPLNPDIVYGGKVTRHDRRTGRVQNVGPVPLQGDNYRVLRTQPIIFSPVDPRVLYFASNVLWKTVTGGQSWTKISPDLTRKTWEVPPSVGKYARSEAAGPTQRGVVYAIAPSYKDVNRIWVGTDDGLIHVTTDGGATWKDVTPPDLKPWAKVSIMDASHFDPLGAYAAINTFRLDDMRPHIYRTHDGGKTWTEITNGIPDGAPVNAVREDPKRKGLLFAGTEREVYFSIDDGDHWQSLRLNMPVTSIRDLVVKDDDLVVGTHGRSIWILDDITPLRQIDTKMAEADVFLFRPELAYRVRWNMHNDTSLQKEEPAGQNPPDGAVIDYYLKSSAAAVPVGLEILDNAGKLVRRYSSADKPEEPLPGRTVMDYWLRPPQMLSTQAGMHRFVWDMHYPPPAVLQLSYPYFGAIYRNMVPLPQGPWVMPGQYTVKLTAGGRTLTQPLTVKMDPRVKTPLVGLSQQFSVTMQLYEALRKDREALEELRRFQAQLRQRRESAPAGTGDAIAKLEQEAGALAGTAGGRGGGGGRGGRGSLSLTSLNSNLGALYNILQEDDRAPTTQAVEAAGALRRQLDTLLSKWRELKAEM